MSQKNETKPVEQGQVEVGEMLCLVREKHGWSFRIETARMPPDGIQFAIDWRGETLAEALDKVRKYIANP